ILDTPSQEPATVPAPSQEPSKILASSPRPPSPTLARNKGQLARSSSSPTPLPGQHVPEELARELEEAADWYLKGGSPWRSIRAIARHFGVHHNTAGDHVQRAERRKGSQPRTANRQLKSLNLAPVH